MVEKIVKNLEDLLELPPLTSPVRTALLQYIGKGVAAPDLAKILKINENTVRRAFNKDAISLKKLFTALVQLLIPLFFPF